MIPLLRSLIFAAPAHGIGLYPYDRAARRPPALISGDNHAMRNEMRRRIGGARPENMWMLVPAKVPCERPVLRFQF
jgi:hypothetical protein